jgi:hypothetical protein
MSLRISLKELCALTGWGPIRVQKEMLHSATYTLNDVTRLRPDIPPALALKRLRVYRLAMRGALHQ